MSSYPLRQSTAGQEVPLGKFVSSSDGFTTTTPTLANTDIKIHKHGATTLANKNSGGATNISNGVQYAVLDATDTDTLGGLVIFIDVSGSLPVKLDCIVYRADVFDGLFTATGWLPVNALAPDWAISGTTLTVGAANTVASQTVKALTGTPGANPITTVESS